MNDKATFEEQRASELAKESLSEREFKEWSEAGHTFLVPCQYNKFFVIYERDGDRAKILETFSIVAVDCNTQEGLGIEIENSQGDSQWISYTPTKLWGYSIYVNVPHRAEVRWDYKPNSNQRIVTFPLIFRVVSEIFNSKDKGPFLSDLSRFRATFEEHKELIL